MTPEEIDRALAELGDRCRSIDVTSVTERFRKHLDHLSVTPGDWARVDELAARVIGREPSVPGLPDHVAAAGRPGAEARRDRLAEMLDETEVLIRVLGNVAAARVTGTNSEEAIVFGRQRALEVITHLALRVSAVDRDALDLAMGCTSTTAPNAVDKALVSARAVLGDALFPPREGGRYELSPAVRTDYGIVCDLVTEADEAGDPAEATDLLRQALSLVRGEPLTGVGRSYPWAHSHRQSIVAQIVDAAEELAEVRLASGDWRSAEWAARQGLRAHPYEERMYRLLMRTARAAGNMPGVQRVFRELCDMLATQDADGKPEDALEPETVEVLEALVGPARRSSNLRSVDGASS